MTLVVARTDGKLISIVADTQLVQNQTRSQPQYGVVKLCALPGGQALGFAHSPELALRDVETFINLFPKGANYTEVTKFFSQSSAATGNEYILGFAKTGLIVKISDGRTIRANSPNVWIGSREAYSKFQAYRCKSIPPPWADRAMSCVMSDNDPAAYVTDTIASAMNCVLADQSVGDVGGFLTILSSNGVDFGFANQCSMYFNNLQPPVGFGHQSNATGENKSYSLSILRSLHRGDNNVGFHFTTNRLTYLFVTDDKPMAHRCVIIKDVETKDLGNYCKDVLKLPNEMHCFAATPA